MRALRDRSGAAARFALITAAGSLALAACAALLLAGQAGAATTAPEPTLTPTVLTGLPSVAIANGTHPLIVQLSAPPAAGSPAPTLTPTVAGSWSLVGDQEVFTPASTLLPCTHYQLTVPAATTATGHAPLGRERTLALYVECPPVAGLQQALARLGYLGARFRPQYSVREPAGRLTRREAAIRAYHAPRGALVPDPAGAPPVRMGTLDATTRGALMVYQDDHGIEATGAPDQATWLSLLASLTRDLRDPTPYTWVTVSESIPETLEVHRGDRIALSTPANTGVAGAETAQGIFPIYSRLVSTTMSGTDPDGTTYDVPDVPWVNYFNGGDAVHGYPRASYGSPQSNGCVELPIETARYVYGMLAIGDIVEVMG